MEKVEEMTHSYALTPLSDQYMVHVDDIDGKLFYIEFIQIIILLIYVPR